MNTHDKRIPLSNGYRLTLQQRNYTIRDVVGFGGSCLAYRAEREANERERELGIPSIPAILKEFYPFELAESIIRKPDGELVAQTSDDTFTLLKNRFERGVAEQTAFCVNDGNHSLPLPTFASLNGTVYSVVVLTKGQTLDECAGSLSMLEKAEVITSLCNAINKLHNSGNLYLDLKPPNIFVFEKDSDETRRVALFDFDTVISVNDITTAIISHSEGWSPHEQNNQQRESISYATDIYSIGAVCYWLYNGKKISDFVLDEIVRERFEFLDEAKELQNNKRLKETIGQILSVTLKRSPNKRVQRVEDILS